MSNFPPPSPPPDGQTYAREFAKRYYNMAASAADATAEYIDLGTIEPTPRTKLGVIVLLPKNGTNTVIQLDRKERQISPGWKALGSDFHTTATLKQVLDAKERAALRDLFTAKANDAKIGGNTGVASKIGIMAVALDL